MTPASLLGESTPRAFWTAADAAVLKFVAAYSAEFRFAGGGVLGRLNGHSTAPIAILARLDNLDLFKQALARLPFSPVFAGGDRLSFVYADAAYQLESLPPAEYARKLESLGLPTGVWFAHDAVQRSTEARQLTDPFGAISGPEPQLRRTSSVGGLPGQTAQLVRGLVDAARYGLAPDLEFRAFRRQTLASTAGSEQEAARIAPVVLGAIAPLGAARQSETLFEVIASPLAASSVGRILGQSAPQLLARYYHWRTRARALGVSSGAVGLATLLGPSWPSSGIRPMMECDPFGLWETRAALAEARRLVESSPPTGQ